MSKITFRAADLVEDLETFDTSKSEVMRRTLRESFVEDASSLTEAHRAVSVVHSASHSPLRTCFR